MPGAPPPALPCAEGANLALSVDLTTGRLPPVIEHHTSITIARQPQDVFAFLSAFERTPEWVPEFREITREDDGPLRIGSTFRYPRKLPVGIQRGTIEIIELEEGRRIGWRALPGPVLPRGTWTLVAADDGQATRVEEHFAAEITGPLKLLTPLLRRQFRRDVGKDLLAAKRQLESEQPLR
jgi:uncharacterized membrane protein